MTAVWSDVGDRWELLSPTGFQDEDALHSLVEQAPDLLPLAGSPRLAVVGREVWLGGSRADLLAIEPNGRLCVIEVKLATNSEARRAVVAQVLSYAAYLYGVSPERLETEILSGHIARRKFSTLAEAAQQAGQDGSFDLVTFREGLATSLRTGAMRLVLVLDEAPAELVRTIGYLQSVTDAALLIDLVTVTAYRVDGRRVLVPQRIEPERVNADRDSETPTTKNQGSSSAAGPDGFIAAIQQAPAEHQAGLTRLAEWAQQLSAEGLATLTTYWGKRGEITLLPRMQPENVGLVTLWNWKGAPAISVFRSVFERRAPNSIAAVERLLAPQALGQGTNVTDISEELLDALHNAYREAASHR